MKPINPRPIFTLSSFTTQSFKTNKNCHHFSFFTTSSQHQNPACNFFPRRREEDSRGVRVSVWWDFENCNLPCNTNVFRVAQCVTNALRANGIKGPIQITAFGDIMQISRTNQEALSSTGINLTHIPYGGKNSSDRSLLVDLMYWVSQNPPPAHLLLISGDRNFAGVLHRLRMNNYNILLASPDSAPSVLCSAATIMWQWSDLLKGEKLLGRLFNQPPDGPYGSWYGHFRGALEDPFAVNEQPSCLPAGESSELASESKPRPIPKAVVNHIRQILHSNPEGISITQLRAELKHSNLTVDKDLYGYQKFSRFLSAMPRVLELHPGEDGQFLVLAVNSKLLDESIPAMNVPVTNNGDLGLHSLPRKNTGEDVPEKLTVVPIPEPKPKSQARNEENQSESSPSMKMQELKTNAQVKNLNGDQKDENWNESSRPAKIDEIKVNHATDIKMQRQEKKRKESPAQRKVQEIQEQDKHVNLQDQQDNVVAPSPIEVKEFSEPNDSNQEDANNKHVAAPKFGFFRRIQLWWSGPGDTNSSDNKKLSGGKDSEEENMLSSQDLNISNLESDSEVEKNSEKIYQMKGNSKQLELFSKDAFWSELGSFIVTSQASALIFQSTTRAHLAKKLQKQGPLSLRSLSEGDLLHLIDLLISEKKWVEEYYSQNPPFKLVGPTRKIPSNDTASSSNGLSRVFSGRKPTLREFGEKKHQNPPHTGVPQPTSYEGSSGKPRSEILNDCQKLVDYITKNYPEGFHVGSFRKLFLERLGYPLDLQKLGYEKLVNLLQIMPGMKIKSNLILPGGPTKSCAIQSNDSNGDSDSSWDELGPVDNVGPMKDEIGVGLTRTPSKLKTEQKIPDYEPLEEEDFSDSDEDEFSNKSEDELKSTKEEEDSSLLRILDSWYGSKEGDKRKDGSKDGDKRKDEFSDAGMPSSSLTACGPRKARKQKPSKSFSFVAEGCGDGKDKMIDGILDSLKKSGERSAETRVLG